MACLGTWAANKLGGLQAPTNHNVHHQLCEYVASGPYMLWSRRPPCGDTPVVYLQLVYHDDVHGARER
jgi:hypothetical protein